MVVAVAVEVLFVLAVVDVEFEMAAVLLPLLLLFSADVANPPPPKVSPAFRLELLVVSLDDSEWLMIVFFLTVVVVAHRRV